MLKWAKYLEREIGSALGYKVTAKKYDVTGSVIELPDDCYRVLMVIPGDYEDELQVRYQDFTWPSVQSDEEDHEDDYYSWLWRPAETTYVNPLLWEVIAEELQLTVDYTDQELTVLYQKIETNQQGVWIINESHSDAIKKYIIYMTAKKFNWKTFKSDKLLRATSIQFVRDLERDYCIAVRHARAVDAETSELEKDQY